MLAVVLLAVKDPQTKRATAKFGDDESDFVCLLRPWTEAGPPLWHCSGLRAPRKPSGSLLGGLRARL